MLFVLFVLDLRRHRTSNRAGHKKENFPIPAPFTLSCLLPPVTRGGAGAKRMPMHRRHLALGLAALAPLPALAQAPATGEGLTTVGSRHGVEETLRRFEAAVRDRNWVVFTRIDHAAAAEAVGLPLRPRTVVVFGNPWMALEIPSY